MKNEIIKITNEEADFIALECFKKISGFNREGERFAKMLEEAKKVRDTIKDKIELKAMVSSFSKESFLEGCAQINGITFICDVFKFFANSNFKIGYTFVLTAGEYKLENEESTLKQLYADNWGTAYVEAGRRILINKLISSVDSELYSYIFGPGYYNMGIDQVKNFFKIIDGEKIGVTVTEKDIMIPVKSSCGFIILTDKQINLPNVDCESCKAKNKNCEYCLANSMNNIHKFNEKGFNK